MITFDGKRALPHRPHLDHLRKQAKARLAEMRNTQPDARLADAQRALAQDYGFPAWGLLRAEVQRRSGAQRDEPFKARRRRITYPERELNDALLEQAAHADSQAAFFMSGAATNIGVLFVLVAIVMSVWLFTAALPGW